MHDLIRPDASFTPRELFARMQGAWLEPRIGSMWQSNNSGVPTQSAGQTIGLLLDWSQQQQLGPELVTNGSFDSDTGWNKGTGWSIANGVATKTGASAGNLIQTIGSFIGKTYRITVDITATSAGRVYVYLGGYDSVAATISGSYVQTITVLNPISNTQLYIADSISTGVFTGSVDNLSIRQVLGNHASQATAANRPLYQLDAKSLPYLAHNSTSSLSVSLPNLSGGVFSSAGSVYFATPQGMSALHNQSIGTTYTLPAPNSSIYGWCVFPARLPPPLEQRLALYMHRLAGLADADFFWQEQATDGMEGQILADDNDTILLRA